MIVVVGLNHETAPLSVREALAFPKERLAEALAKLRDETGRSWKRARKEATASAQGEDARP